MYIHTRRHGRKVKILKWFEQVFDRVSGDDQLLQLDEFKRALQISGVCMCVCVCVCPSM